jgi:hypothetical protein
MVRHKFNTYIMVDNNTNAKGTMDTTFKFEDALVANIMLEKKNYLLPGPLLLLNHFCHVHNRPAVFGTVTIPHKRVINVSYCLHKISVKDACYQVQR